MLCKMNLLLAGDVTGLVIPDVLMSDAELNIGCLLSTPGGNPENVLHHTIHVHMK